MEDLYWTPENLFYEEGDAALGQVTQTSSGLSIFRCFTETGPT